MLTSTLYNLKQNYNGSNYGSIPTGKKNENFLHVHNLLTKKQQLF